MEENDTRARIDALRNAALSDEALDELLDLVKKASPEKKQIIRLMLETPETVGSTEAAKALGVNAVTVKRMAKRGELPAVIVGGRWKFKAVDLAAYLEQAQVRPSQPEE